MTKSTLNQDVKRFTFGVTGFVVLILGVALILLYWNDVVILFRGIIGIILALAGLFTLYCMNLMDKK